MNQHSLYYTFIICCLIYVILIGQRFHAIKPHIREPRIIITQLPSFSLSKQYTDITISYNSDVNMHVNNAYSISSTNTKNNKFEIKRENNAKNLEQINKRLYAMLLALQQNNTTIVKRIMQPHNKLISLLYQESAAIL